MSADRALVTGGFGFVGAQLCRALVEAGSELAVLDDLSVGAAENLEPSISSEAQALIADVRDVETVERHLRAFGATRVFHLAAVHFIPTCERQPALAISVNVAGSQALLEACARVGSVESVVVASSGAIYAPAESAHAEDAAVAPTDVYGMSKEWTERLAGYFHDTTRIPVGIARIFNVVGPGETNPHLLPAIIEQVRDGVDLRLGNLSTRRDYVFSGDVADGLARLADRCRDVGVVTCNLGSETATSGAALVELVARLSGRELSVTPDAARFRDSDRPVLLSDCSRAHSALDWRAETSLEDAVAAALAQPFAQGFVSTV